MSGRPPGRLSPRWVEFFTPVTTRGASCPALPASSNAALVAHALTKTSAPDTTPKMAIRGGKNNSNRARPTEDPSATPRQTANLDSDITLAATSVESDGNSDYVESRKNMPTSSAKKSEIEGHIQELQQMQ